MHLVVKVISTKHYILRKISYSVTIGILLVMRTLLGNSLGTVGLSAFGKILGPALNGHTSLCHGSLICVMPDNCKNSEEGRSSFLLMPQESSGPSSSSDNDHYAAVSSLD